LSECGAGRRGNADERSDHHDFHGDFFDNEEMMGGGALTGRLLWTQSRSPNDVRLTPLEKFKTVFQRIDASTEVRRRLSPNPGYGCA
jgi:hypothetical protein